MMVLQDIMIRHCTLLFYWFGTAFLAFGQPAAPLRLESRIELPGVNGRIDHLSVDIKSKRLFVAALGNHTLEVLDLNASRVVKSIPELAEPQGVLYDPATNKLFVACAGDGSTRIFDARSYQLLTTAHFSADADNLRYEPENRRVIVGYGEGALGMLDEKGNKAAEIRLDAHPESFQLESKGPRIFVNVPDRKEIEVADRRKGTVVARWPVTRAQKNFPMALDEAHGLLFTGCRAPARLLVLNLSDGKVIAEPPIVGDTDDLFYDSARQRVYVIGGEGFIDTLRQVDAGHYERIDRTKTAPGARTGLFVPAFNRLYVAVPHRGAQHAEVLVYETQ